MISLSTNSTFILINDIQTDLFLEHVQAHLIKEKKMTLSITWDDFQQKGDSVLCIVMEINRIRLHNFNVQLFPIKFTREWDQLFWLRYFANHILGQHNSVQTSE